MRVRVFPLERPSVHALRRLAGVVLTLGVAVSTIEGAQTPGSAQTPTFSLSITETADVVEDVATTRRIDRSEIDALHARTLDQALALVPGIYVRTGGDGTPRVDVRGFRSRHVLLLIDGIPANSTDDGQFDPARISTESIREIKIGYGSSSTLYGDSALGGVIEVITDRPRSGLAGNFTAALGDTTEHDVGGTMTATNGRASLVVGGSTFSTGGSRLPRAFAATPAEDGGRRLASDRERKTFLAKFGYDVSGSLKIGTLLSVGTGSYGIPPSTINDQQDRFAQATRYERVDQYRTIAGQVSFGYLPPGPFTLRGWAYVNQQDEDRGRYDDARYASMEDPAIPGTFQTRNTPRISGGSILGRIDIGRAGRLRLAVNRRGESFDSSGVIRDVAPSGSGTGGGRGGGGGGRGGALEPVRYSVRSFDVSHDLDVYSAAAEWEFRPFAGTGVVLGVSENWQRRQNSRLTGVSWLGGLSYDLSSAMRVHASASHKIRFPSIQQLYDEAAGNLGLAPERSHEFEVGLERKWGTRSRLSIAGFSTRATDFIERDQGARFVNQDRYRFTGTEVTAETRVLPILDFRVAYSFLDATDLSPEGGFAELQYRPRHRTALDTRWSLPARFSARGALHYVADQVYYSRGLPLLQARAGDYALVNASVARRLGDRYDVTVAVDNVFDELYEQSYGLPREGRTSTVRLRGRF